SRHIGEILLARFFGRATGWTYQMHQVWPAPPNSPWEAWLYLAHFLARRKTEWPAFLAHITPEAEVGAFVRAWQRREAIEHWEKRLGEFATRAETDDPGLMELRAVFEPDGVRLEARDGAQPAFALLKKRGLAQMERDYVQGSLHLTEPSRIVWEAFQHGLPREGVLDYRASAAASFNALLRQPLIADQVVTPAREPFRRAAEPLRWKVEPAGSAEDDYSFSLVLPDGTPPPPALVAVDGRPALYVTQDAIYEAPPLGTLSALEPNRIPAPVIETSRGVTLLDSIGVELPPALAGRTRTVTARVIFQCALEPHPYNGGERLTVRIRADLGSSEPPQIYSAQGWERSIRDWAAEPGIARIDRTPLRATPGAVEALGVTWSHYHNVWERQAGKKFPGEFVQWLEQLPPGIEVALDPQLATLRGDPIAASVRLDVEETAVDWFDLRVALDVSDTTLTPEEINALLDAHGGFVRLGAKGWRRLQFNLSEEDDAQLADLGLSARDFSSEPHRLHALQLAGRKAARLLPEQHAAAIQRRAEEIQTRVAPPVPAAIDAELRPYQLEGFHFLSYLATNRFGGILADDMGLGKTVQTLTWLAWLRDGQPILQTNGGAALEPAVAESAPSPPPSLVVCPKSVMDTWAAEARRFLPSLRVRLLAKGACDAAAVESACAESDLVVVNYTQLRLLEDELRAVEWHAVILDEAQYIKNPESQTARIAVALRTGHRLALSGTPIENRLLDLWSIMAFAMPGVLGNRAQFTKRYDQRSDPLARRRLAARVRPFVLRRTKGEVAKDLPERMEEDLLCELEDEQATLYRAELKRARQQLLRLKTQQELDKARFNILTSLLRLRQICCHPALVKAAAGKAESAKLTALLDLLEPLIEEGHKVLVFSQFVEMLALIRTEVQARGWREFLLTGGTEDRGPLVEEFQRTEGAAVFLISLRAGGFGLNLTAASYVVLFDPWWNPAVESQAIDRTHRIGQTNKVIAYRLLVKESIEEKIRRLQKQKRALAADILGEEAFARTLTLEDFRFLLEE
ncbi:MAG: DEAD/DEAH box helicase, partial [Verrucomicrobiota bacterium]|nr:DEAD/DEAH box helicase [Verrucomicrobiota bacterium]